MQYTKFADIPKFTSFGHWESDYSMAEVAHTVKQWQEEMNLDIDPDFQRDHVWTEAQQIAWMEFYLRGGNTGRTLYFNFPGWQRSFKGDFVLVDGKQRLNAIFRFLNNEFPVFGDSYYKDFTDSIHMLQSIKINVNNLKTRSEVLKWYLEMNTGGTPHTEEELNRVGGLLEIEALPGQWREVARNNYVENILKRSQE